jgi:hypothetical protein
MRPVGLFVKNGKLVPRLSSACHVSRSFAREAIAQGIVNDSARIDPS